MRVFFKRALCAAAALPLLAGCGGGASSGTGYDKYIAQFYDTFDTIVQVVGYSATQKEFDEITDRIHLRFQELNKLYDRFYEYTDINNIATINKNAGIAPVKVDKEIIDLIKFGLEWGEKTDGQINIAMGPVLEIWHEYMERYAGSTEGELPDSAVLEALRPLCDPDGVIVDEQAGTVYLEREGMMLDVGAVAKGYATQLVADEVYAEGFASFIISAGGNVVAGDGPLDGVRRAWGIGIQDPAADVNDTEAPSIDVLFVKNTSVVTSGDYQRYYFAGEQRVHHIIDPDTLMPAYYYRSLSVITEDSGEADCLSTALFCMDYEQSRALAEELGVEVIWVFEDGSVEYTESLLSIMRDRGGAANTLN